MKKGTKMIQRCSYKAAINYSVLLNQTVGELGAF